MSSINRVWFVSGASTGIGLATVKLALDKGARVVAGLRKPEALAALTAQYPPSQLAVTRLDVTDPKSVREAFDFAHQTFGRIDVVYNNAGISAIGEVEGIPDDVARNIFEVNFWGALSLTREAVRFFREVNPKGQGGHLIQAGSSLALHSFPIIGVYSASKHALDAITESLAAELRPEWNIKVTLAEFGAVESELGANATWTDVHPAYVDSVTGKPTARGILDTPFPRAKAESAVAVMYKVTELDSPPLRILIGQDTIKQVNLYNSRLNEDIAKYEGWSSNLELVSTPL